MKIKMRLVSLALVILFAQTSHASMLRFEGCHGHISYIDNQGGFFNVQSESLKIFNARFEFDSVTGIGSGEIDLRVLMRSGEVLEVQKEDVKCEFLKETLPGQIGEGELACHTIRPIIKGQRFFVSIVAYSGSEPTAANSPLLHGAIMGELTDIQTGNKVDPGGFAINRKTCN